jgi:hypothetical protein
MKDFESINVCVWVLKLHYELKVVLLYEETLWGFINNRFRKCEFSRASFSIGWNSFFNEIFSNLECHRSTGNGGFFNFLRWETIIEQIDGHLYPLTANTSQS